MHRAATLVVTLFLLLALSLHSATARQATPTAGAPTPDVGTTVAVIGNDGTEIAAVTVTELTDPFDGYDPGSPPERGFHFVALNVTIANTGTRTFEADPYDISLIDADGFRYGLGSVYRGSDPTPPDFERQGELAPGAEVSGLIAFQVLNSVDVAQVLYTPESDRLITLVDRRADPPAPGAAVPFLNPEGAEAGQVTISDVVDPFAAYDPSDQPVHGYHYVLVTATIANTGSQPLEADPGDLFLVDAEGFLAEAGSMRRGENATPPDFERQDGLAPGADATGVISYQLLNTSTPVAIVYAPDGDRLVTVATFGASAAPRPTPHAGDATVTPTAATEPTTTAEVDCNAIVAWFNPTNERFERMSTIFEGLPTFDDATAADLPDFRQAAADVAALGEEQRNSQPPPQAEAFNVVIVDYFTNTRQALDLFADGLEENDPAKRMVALANMGEFQQQFQADGTTLFNDLAALCPG